MIKALVAALGSRSTSRSRVIGRAARRWSFIWILLLLLDIFRFLRRRQSRVIARRVLKDDEVLVISNSSTREHQ